MRQRDRYIVAAITVVAVVLVFQALPDVAKAGIVALIPFVTGWSIWRLKAAAGSDEEAMWPSRTVLVVAGLVNLYAFRVIYGGMVIQIERNPKLTSLFITAVGALAWYTGSLYQTRLAFWLNPDIQHFVARMCGYVESNSSVGQSDFIADLTEEHMKKTTKEYNERQATEARERKEGSDA